MDDAINELAAGHSNLIFFQPRMGRHTLERGNAPFMAIPRSSSPVRGEMFLPDKTLSNRSSRTFQFFYLFRPIRGFASIGGNKDGLRPSLNY